jgi:hypothetical protein
MVLGESEGEVGMVLENVLENEAEREDAFSGMERVFSKDGGESMVSLGEDFGFVSFSGCSVALLLVFSAGASDFDGERSMVWFTGKSCASLMETVLASSPGRPWARTRVRQTMVKEKDLISILGSESAGIEVFWFDRFGTIVTLNGIGCADATCIVWGNETVTSSIRRGVEERVKMDDPDGVGDRESREKSFEERLDAVTGSLEMFELVSRPFISGFDAVVVAVFSVFRSVSVTSLVRLVVGCREAPGSREPNFDDRMTG